VYCIYSRLSGPTSLAIGVGVDLADQEAALVELAVGLLGDAHQRVSSSPEPPRGVGGGVCADLSQLGHGPPHLLFIASQGGRHQLLIYTRNTYTYIYICVFIFIYVYTHVYMWKYVYICVYTVYTLYIHIYTHVYMCIYIHVYTCVFIHIYTHVYMCIYT